MIVPYGSVNGPVRLSFPSRPSCCGPMWKHGSYMRFLEDIGTYISIPRWICNKCNVTISGLPDELESYFQTSFPRICQILFHRLRFKQWPSEIPRQRAGHWLSRFWRRFQSEPKVLNELKYLNWCLCESKSFLK